MYTVIPMAVDDHPHGGLIQRCMMVMYREGFGDLVRAAWARERAITGSAEYLLDMMMRDRFLEERADALERFGRQPLQPLQQVSELDKEQARIACGVAQLLRSARSGYSCAGSRPPLRQCDIYDHPLAATNAHENTVRLSEDERGWWEDMP